MSLKKLYADALLGETLREFRKGRKYIGGPDDESNEENAQYMSHLRGHEFWPTSPRLSETIGLGASKDIR